MYNIRGIIMLLRPDMAVVLFITVLLCRCVGKVCALNASVPCQASGVFVLSAWDWLVRDGRGSGDFGRGGDLPEVGDPLEMSRVRRYLGCFPSEVMS